MGGVYLGHDTRLDRAVAIKALPEHLADHPDRLARFEREARTLASISHPTAGLMAVPFDIRSLRVEGTPVALLPEIAFGRNNVPVYACTTRRRGNHAPQPGLRPLVRCTDAVLFDRPRRGVETYAVLTRLPAPHRLTPADAWALLSANLVEPAKVVALEGPAHAVLLARLAAVGTGGGRTSMR